jgi:glycosyltransferase involved in cell wall biosynthesis
VRILYVIGSLSPKHGGPSKACLEMANAMAARGHQVEVFTTDDDVDRHWPLETGRPVRQGAVDVTWFRSQSIRLWPGASIDLVRALAARIPEFDVVHTHSLYQAHSAILAATCAHHAVPFLIRPCGALDPVVHGHGALRKAVFEWLVERRNFRLASAIHFTSEEERTNAGHVMPFRGSIVVPLGVAPPDEAMAAAPPLASLYPELADKEVVLFLGRLAHKKGLDLLIPAFARVASRRPQARLLLAGPDADGFGAKVRDWVQENGIEDKVVFSGMLEGEAKAAALRDSRLFALTSHGENFGVAVAEAMAAGLPVLITDQVAIWPEVKAAGAGVVTRCDVDEIAQALDQLLADRRSLAAAGTAARRLAQTAYSWPAIAERLETEYVRLLGRAPRAEAA